MSDRQPNAFVARMSSAFKSEIYTPLFQRAAERPEDVLAVIGELREKLDILSNAVSGLTDRPPRATGPADAHAADTHEPASRTHFDGAGQPDEIGRNQRSRLRELTLLELLSGETRAYSLQQIVNALNANGFNDTNAAIVSQLHRLKKLGVVDQPANGMYLLTDSGLSHLRQLRTSFAGLRN